MIEITNKEWLISVDASNKSKITLDTNNNEVKIDDLNVVHAGEFEKSGILLEVKEYAEKLFYSFTIDSKLGFFSITGDGFSSTVEFS